jgi:hypothetical protein
MNLQEALELYYGKPLNESKAKERPTRTDRCIEELHKAGLYDKDSDYAGMLGEAVEELLRLFAIQEHSGFSASLCNQIFHTLIEGNPLTPLTTDESEWTDGIEIGGPNNGFEKGEFLLSNRSSGVTSSTKLLSENKAVFDGIIWKDPEGFTYTNKDSIVEFTLPGFPPKPIFRDAPADTNESFEDRKEVKIEEKYGQIFILRGMDLNKD